MKLKGEVGIRAKKYTNKICRDNHVHYSYIPTLVFLDYSYHTPVDDD